MKKLFVAVLAVAGLAACNTEETVLVQGPAPIAFDGSFVETRATEAVDPSITTENITAFDVWGFMDEATGQIFDREHVTGTKGNFTYANTQYWVPEHKYYFAATAPAQSKNIVLTTPATGEAAKLGLGVVDFTVTDGAEDFLYSAVGPIDAPEAGATSVDPVKFEFNHMLSKVKFTFTNGFENELATIDVTDVRMVVPSKGTIKLDQADWWSTNQWVLGSETVELAFGDACKGLAVTKSEVAANERIVLPANDDVVYTVTFGVKLYQGSVLAYEGTKTVKIEGVALEIGKAYNFKAELNAKNITADGSELLPIVFDVEVVKDWVEAGDQTGVIEGAVTNQTLMADAEATQTVNLAGNLDGAGHTISGVADVDYVVSNTARLIEATAPSTISNLTIDGNNIKVAKNGTEYGIRGIYTIGTGDIKIENVEIINCTYGINANNNGKLTVLNSTLQSWNSFGNKTVCHFENVTFTAGSHANFRPYDTTVCKNCEFTGVTIDLSMFASTNTAATITFDNCTFNGAALTAADLTDAAGKNVTIIE